MKMLPPTVVIEQKTPQRLGRPRLTEPGSEPAAVHLKLTPDDYDKAYEIAKRERTSIQDVIRAALKRFIENERGTTIGNKKT